MAKVSTKLIHETCWAIRTRNNGLCMFLAWTRRDAIKELCDALQIDWAKARKGGFIAIKVRVTEIVQ